MVLHLPQAEGGFDVTFNNITKDAAFYTSTSRFVAWFGTFPRTARCPRMILRTPPRHPPRSFSSVQSMPPSWPITTVRTDSAPPQSQPGAGIRAGSPQFAARVFAATGGRPSLSCATQQASGSVRPRPCGQRTPPTLLSPPSPHNAASRTRFSSTGGRFRSLSRRWRSHTAQSSSASAGRGASSALPWTRCCRRRWGASSLRKKIPPSVCFGTSPCNCFV